VSPLQFKFPNGSKIIFKGMDNKEKIKSLTNVSIAWIEECSELSLEAYLEILGRVRTYGVSMHFILTCNPIGKFNWVYQTFFSKTQEDGTTKTIVPDELFYEKRILVKNGVYYHHSTCDDNPYLPRQYIIRLDEMKNYDKSLWLVARLGRFGEAGLRVLPQFETLDDKVVYAAVAGIEEQFHKCGMDFGFETSYNAVVKCAVDLNRHILYIYDEYYKNHMTDDKTAIDLVNWDSNIKNILIKGDCAEPKTIQYFRQEGFNMRPCRKLAESKTEGSRIANTKKIKRFARIICARHCINTIRELKDLTYKKNKNGEVNYGDFNIDSHTFKLKSVA
jgi:phage terminase large subunit